MYYIYKEYAISKPFLVLKHSEFFMSLKKSPCI